MSTVTVTLSAKDFDVLLEACEIAARRGVDPMPENQITYTREEMREAALALAEQTGVDYWPWLGINYMQEA